MRFTKTRAAIKEYNCESYLDFHTDNFFFGYTYV